MILKVPLECLFEIFVCERLYFSNEHQNCYLSLIFIKYPRVLLAFIEKKREKFHCSVRTKKRIEHISNISILTLNCTLLGRNSLFRALIFHSKGCLSETPLLILFGSNKGQLNSKWIYEVIVSSKIPTKNYRDFYPIF